MTSIQIVYDAATRRVWRRLLSHTNTAGDSFQAAGWAGDDIRVSLARAARPRPFRSLRTVALAARTQRWVGRKWRRFLGSGVIETIMPLAISIPIVTRPPPRALVAAIALLVAGAQAAAGEPNPFNMEPGVDAAIRTAIRDLYDVKIDTALARLSALEHAASSHPFIAAGVATCHWFRMSYDVMDRNPAWSDPFVAAAERCIALSEKRIAEGDPTGEGHFSKGLVLGLLGRWEIANGHMLTAYFRGRAARAHLEKTRELNPSLADPLMGLGIFEYYAAKLPAVVRVLAFFGVSGDLEAGLNRLRVAADESAYLKTPARLFLANILAGEEDRPRDAIAIIDGVRDRHPQSPFVDMVLIKAVYNAGDVDRLAAIADTFMDRVRSGVYRQEFAAQAFFNKGLVHLKRKEWGDAARTFAVAAARADVDDPFGAWATLYRGFSLDALGRREEAVALYREVLRMERRWSSHAVANRYLDRPFAGTPEDLAVLRL